MPDPGSARDRAQPATDEVDRPHDPRRALRRPRRRRARCAGSAIGPRRRQLARRVRGAALRGSHPGTCRADGPVQLARRGADSESAGPAASAQPAGLPSALRTPAADRAVDPHPA